MSPKTAQPHGFLRHVLNYGVVSVFQKALALLMLPFYTRWLHESEYGAVAITDLVLVVLAELFGRHLLAGMSRQYFLRTIEKDRRAVVSTTTLLALGASWLVCGAALPFCDDLAPLFLGSGDSLVGPDRLATLLTLTLLILPCQLTSQAGLAYLQIQKRSQLFAGVHVVKMLVELTLKVVLLGVFGWGVEGFLASVLVGEALTALFVTGGVLFHVGVRFEGAVLGPLVRFALPLVPVGVCQLGLHQLDRRLLEHLAPGENGLSWTGIYGLGYLVGATPISVLLNALFGIWQPSIYGIEERDRRQRALARDTTWTLLVVASICALTCFAGKPLVDLLAGREGFRQAYRVVPWVACGYTFWSLYAAIQLSFYAERRTGALIGVNGAALVVNVGLNWILIPRFGFVGAAAATTATFAVLATLAAVVSKRACPAPFAWRRLLPAIGLALTCGLVAVWFDGATAEWSALASIAVRVLLLVVACAAILGFLVAPEERRLLLESTGERLRRARSRA